MIDNFSNITLAQKQKTVNEKNHSIRIEKAKKNLNKSEVDFHHFRGRPAALKKRIVENPHDLLGG